MVNRERKYSPDILQCRKKFTTHFNYQEAVTLLYFFVIQGAFEVANRLLEARDGLGLWSVKEVELEALSNEAIVLVLQFA